MTVFLLWQNDGVVGVFASEAKAQDNAHALRTARPGLWVESGPRRWYQPEGRIARLEIEERIVR